jgi:pimeloyl-ACP methyl ester carboxylesterase
MSAETHARPERHEWTATVNGTGLRVEEVGTGDRVVVCAPALFTNRELFDPLVAALSGDHRVIRYDHRGQGDSGFGAPQPAGQLGVEGLYEDALALLDQLGVERCDWVGASVGGFVGLRLAARHPARIRSLVLIGLSLRPLTRAELRQVDLFTGMIRATRRLGPVGAAVRGRVTTQVMRNMFGPSFMTDPARAVDRAHWRPRFAAQTVPEGAPMLRAVFGHPGNPPELLAAVHAPTLVVMGEEDPGALPEVRLAERTIPDARVVTVARAGHMVLVEQPAAGTAAITAFLGSVDAR